MSLASTKNDHPAANEIEVSLFGPGVGECIVCHIGDGKWIVVDSCINGKTKNPIAIDYLRNLNVDISENVKLVVATHWHDDHVRGISDVFSQSSKSKFACSAALSNQNFLALLEASGNINLIKASTGIDELKATFEECRKTKALRKMTGPDIWAQDKMILLEDNSGTLPVQIRSLSPSSHVVTSSIGRFSQLIPDTGESFKRFHMNRPNDTSIVLQLRIGSATILLGGDLEIGSNDSCGWRGIMMSEHHTEQKSDCFKIAHHGSNNGDHPPAWKKLVGPQAIAILTPYAKGVKPLPSEEDVKRLKDKPGEAYITAYPPSRRPKRRRKLEKTINEVLSKRSSPRSTPGHIRVRLKVDAVSIDPNVSLFNGAVDLSQI